MLPAYEGIRDLIAAGPLAGIADDKTP